jgi:tRNA G18 (ribose-2'-O)-methylase SpoU
MNSDIFFMQCGNPDCRFRFPLDLEQFQGKVCPICGAMLTKTDPRLPQWTPPWRSGIFPELRLVLDNIRSAHNVGSIFRTSEGVGVTRLYLCGLTPSPEQNPAIAKTALGAQSRLDWQRHANCPDLCRQLKAEGFQLIALEALPQAVSLFDWKPGMSQKIALVLGSEPAGVDPALIAIADEVVYIPMTGEKSSLNVSVACGVALCALLTKY